MDTTKSQLLDALKLTGDKPEDLVCFYQAPVGKDPPWYPDEFSDPIRCAFADLPEHEITASWGGEPCIAFSERYVYVRVECEGEERFAAVPRHPKWVTKPIPTL